MRWRPLFVALLAVTAGCSSAIVGESGPEETATPAPVPDDASGTGQQRGDVVPGITEREIAEAGLLAQSHAVAVRNRSYVWREERTVETAVDYGDTLDYRRVARVESPSVYHLRSNYRAVDRRDRTHYVSNYSEYADGHVRHVRYRHPARPEPRYRQIAIIDPVHHPLIGMKASREIRRYLDVERATVAERTIDGRTYYRIAGGTDEIAGVGNVSDFRVTASVSPDGFVRSMNVTYRTRVRNETRRVAYSFEYVRIDETTVEDPDWVSTSGRDRVAAGRSSSVGRTGQRPRGFVRVSADSADATGTQRRSKPPARISTAIPQGRSKGDEAPDPSTAIGVTLAVADDAGAVRAIPA